MIYVLILLALVALALAYGRTRVQVTHGTQVYISRAIAALICLGLICGVYLGAKAGIRAVFGGEAVADAQAAPEPYWHTLLEGGTKLLPAAKRSPAEHAKKPSAHPPSGGEFPNKAALSKARAKAQQAEQRQIAKAKAKAKARKARAAAKKRRALARKRARARKRAQARRRSQAAPVQQSSPRRQPAQVVPRATPAPTARPQPTAPPQVYHPPPVHRSQPPPKPKHRSSDAGVPDFGDG